MPQGFGSATLWMADPDLLGTDPPENILKFKMSKREICYNSSNNRIA